MGKRLLGATLSVFVALYAVKGSTAAGGGLSMHLACSTPNNNENKQYLYFSLGQNIANVPEPVCLEARAAVPPGHVKDAAISQNRSSHEIMVKVHFDSVGKAQLADVSSKNRFKKMAWVLDSKIVLLVTIVEPLNDGVLEIRGLGSKEANALARAIRGDN